MEKYDYICKIETLRKYLNGFNDFDTLWKDGSNNWIVRSEDKNSDYYGDEMYFDEHLEDCTK